MGQFVPHYRRSFDSHLYEQEVGSVMRLAEKSEGGQHELPTFFVSASWCEGVDVPSVFLFPISDDEFVALAVYVDDFHVGVCL